MKQYLEMAVINERLNAGSTMHGVEAPEASVELGNREGEDR